MSDNKIQYNGQCAFAVNTGKTNIKAGDKHTLIKDGKVYAFSNPIAKFLFKLLPNRIQKVDEVWNSQK